MDIPPGVDNGMAVHLAGQGAGEGRNAGDLIVEIEVAPDPYFRRRGKDLYVDVSVPITTVAEINKIISLALKSQSLRPFSGGPSTCSRSTAQ